MNITKRLKQWLIENMGVKEDASDNDFKQAVGMAFAEDKLSQEKFAELAADEEGEEAKGLLEQFKNLNTQLAETLTQLKSGSQEQTPPAEETPEEQEAPASKAAPASKLAKAVASMGGTPVDTDGKSVDIRVKEAAEMYDTSRKAMVFPEETKKGNPHPMAGRPVSRFGAQMYESSDLGKALSGVWAKFQLRTVSPRLAGNAERAFHMFTDHEKDLFCYMVENEQWDDSQDKKLASTKGYRNRQGGSGLKALIDDSTSGGLEAAPIVFDDNVIETPLLYGELFPRVNQVPLDRGRRIEGVSTGTVTGSWGGVDDSAISLFDTTSYVSAFDTTIYRWEGSVRIGLDFLSDTPIDFGAHITRQYGERLLEDLDDVVAVGNGTTQPEGVMNASGATTVAFSGTTSLGNYESLRFGVAKAEHGPTVKSSAVFCGTETSYQRAMAIPVGASDARRLGGMEYDSYRWMQRPYAINESLSNQQIFYAIMARYRMYIRRGFTVRTSTEGDTLIRNNEMLIVVMGRYGGQMERGGPVAVTTTAES